MSNAAPVPTLIFEETSNRGPTPFHPLNFSPAEYLRPHKTTATVTKNIIIISPILLSSPCSTPIVLNVNPTAYQPTKTSQQASLMEETHSNLSYLSSNDNHIAVVPNAHLILRIAAASIHWNPLMPRRCTSLLQSAPKRVFFVPKIKINNITFRFLRCCVE